MNRSFRFELYEKEAMATDGESAVDLNASVENLRVEVRFDVHNIGRHVNEDIYLASEMFKRFISTLDFPPVKHAEFCHHSDKVDNYGGTK